MNTQFGWQHIWTNIVVIAAAIIGIVGMIFVNIYFKPDLWYEEGPYYRSGDRAIASLRIQNFGHDDAQEIRVSVVFPDTILDVTAGDDANPFVVKTGGIGSKVVTGTIHRLVPNESIYLYFAVKNPDGPVPISFSKFASPSGIVYKGGMANEGKPSSWMLVLLLGAGWLLTIAAIFYSLIINTNTTRKIRSTVAELADFREKVHQTQEKLQQVQKMQEGLSERRDEREELRKMQRQPDNIA